MRVTSFFILFTILFALSCSGSLAALQAEHTADEWRSILSVSGDDGKVTGLQITLTIEPDEYYLQEGEMVNLSGVISNVFGPIPNADLTLSRGIDGAPMPYQNLTADEEGRFLYSDIINSTGIIRYQASYQGSDFKTTNQTRSNEIEILAKKNSTEDILLSVNFSPEDDLILAETSPDQIPNETNTSSPTKPDTADLTLQGEPQIYYSGQNISFRGELSSEGKGVAHIPVTLEHRTGNNTYTKIGDVLSTDRNGTYTTAYHLTGPYDPNLRAVADRGIGSQSLSDILPLTFQDDTFSAPARERKDIRTIDAAMSPAAILTEENVTISGWFADGNGDPIPYGILNIYWYNFADQIWDRYKANAEIITNKDGFFACNISGPSSAGLSYLSVVSAREKTGKPLFSQILPLTVREPESLNETSLAPQITGQVSPSEVSIGQQAQVTFTLTDPSGFPMAGELVTMLFSEDGFTWFMNGSGNVTTRSDGTVGMTDTPKRPGFHYYRGVYDGSELFGPADSGILTLIITSPESSTA